jgi:hypothetical protein
MKKQPILKLPGLFLLFILFFNSAKAQPPFWKLNGNPAAGPDLVNTTNNFIGTGFGASNNNTFMKMGVNFNQDIFIDNLPAPIPGRPAQLLFGNQGGHWIGLGRIFTPSVGPGANIVLAPQAHLHIHGGNSTGSSFTTGLRQWFQTGTLYTEETDGMYVS